MEQKENAARSREWYGILQMLVWSVATVMLVFIFAFRLSGVRGHSMEPTLQEGDLLLVMAAHLCGGYEQGDIVIAAKSSFESGKPIVKRVIATEGQVVDIDFTTGSVYVDGQRLQEAYINEPAYRAEGMEFPLRVPEGSVFLMGDNRNHSTDSRSPMLGTVDTRCIIGKAVLLLFPGPDEADGKRDFGRIGGIA